MRVDAAIREAVVSRRAVVSSGWQELQHRDRNHNTSIWLETVMQKVTLLNPSVEEEAR